MCTFVVKFRLLQVLRIHPYVPNIQPAVPGYPTLSPHNTYFEVFYYTYCFQRPFSAASGTVDHSTVSRDRGNCTVGSASGVKILKTSLIIGISLCFRHHHIQQFPLAKDPTVLPERLLLFGVAVITLNHRYNAVRGHRTGPNYFGVEDYLWSCHEQKNRKRRKISHIICETNRIGRKK